MSAQRGLGKGFGALIPQNFDESILLDESERVQKLPLGKIWPNADQPRQKFDETALGELAESIRRHGVLQPIVVTPVEDGYRIIAGERRFRAAKIAKLATIPAIVRTLRELEQLEIALVENVQRVDLSPLEQAVSIGKLHNEFNLSFADIAKRLGKAMSTVNNTSRLLKLSDNAKQALMEGKITEGHARSILAVTDPILQQQLLDNIIKHGWSVRQAERFVVSVNKGHAKTGAEARERAASTETAETKRLAKHLGTPVHVRRMAKGGKLEITFTSDEELTRIIKSIS